MVGMAAGKKKLKKIEKKIHEFPLFSVSTYVAARINEDIVPNIYVTG